MKLSLQRQFLLSVVIYMLAVLALWFVYHTVTNRAIRESESERVILATENLTRQIGAQFESMNLAVSVIAGSEYVFDFLREDDTTAFYEKAGAVSEIIRRAVFPITTADSVIAISENGRHYRFSGGLSNSSLEALRNEFGTAETVYTIVELDGTMFFCHSVPAIDYSGRMPVTLGNILLLTGLDRTSRMLDADDGADRMVIIDGTVALSNNPELEGMTVAEVESLYGAFLTQPLSGTYLSVAAAIPDDVLYAENILFFLIAIVSLGLMIAMILTLYYYHTKYIIKPMSGVIAHIREIGGGSDKRLPEISNGAFDELAADINKMIDRMNSHNAALISERQKLFDSEIARQNMRIMLLSNQIDAHFVVNTLNTIKHLADTGVQAQAGEMANGLASILQHRHTGDAMVNVFDDFVMLEKYIDIMNMKFDGKFTVEFNVEDKLEECLMPGFILQPIVENALTHGLQSKDEDARLIVTGYLRDNKAVFKVKDNGAGIDADKLQKIKQALSDTQVRDFPDPGLRGIALMNIQKRIRIQCGEQYGLEVESEPDGGTEITVSLPVVYENEN